MGNSANSFERKVEHRLYAIKHSERDESQETVDNTWETASEESRIWDNLNENLSAADACKFFDGYLPLYSHRRFLGPFIIFCKKVIRKLLKIFLGWYLFPIYQRQSHFNGKIINSVSSERDLLSELFGKINHLNETVQRLEKQNRELTDKLNTVADELHGERQRLKKQNQELTDKLNTVADELHGERQRLKKQNQELTDKLNTVADELHGERQRLSVEIRNVRENAASELKEAVEELHSQNQSLMEDTNCLQEALRATDETISAFQANVSTMSARTNDRLRKIENLPTDDDEFYHCFEERFRGSRKEIRDRLQFYIPIIQEHLPDWSGGTFVDVGSGRGEWLDLLKENGAVDYVGVDLNQKQNEICEGFGHKTICEDCIAYLTDLPEESVDLISGFQIIEHLCMSDLMELLKQSYRVLKNGGMILFETQNPRNLIVGADTFFIDPSHKRVLEPQTVEFLAEWCGYCHVQIFDANSSTKWAGITEESIIQENKEIVKAINELYWLVYGPQDYALFAVKE